MLFESILFLTLLISIFIIVLERKLDPIPVNFENSNSTFKNYKYSTPKIVRLAQAILPAVILLFIIRSFIFEGFRVSSVSMQPTLNSGDWIVVDKYSAGLRVPLLGYRFSKTNLQRGDVIVMRGGIAGQNLPLIKRIAGLPGDRITLQANIDQYAHTDLIVPKDTYYVIGDNFADSQDSRIWGVIEDREIIGKARFKLFSKDWKTSKINIFQSL